MNDRTKEWRAKKHERNGMQDKKRLKIMTSQRNNDEYAGDSR